MQKIKKVIVTAVFLTALVGFLCVNVSSVEAATVEELQALIAQLQAEIAAIQAQLDELQSGATWCHDFNVNLRYGDVGNEIQSLQIALESEGFSIPDAEKKGVSYFGNHTASAVVGFQEKYAAEILAPWGLAHGTGYVGTTTRAKLNELYGCAEEEKSITVLSPNGGEEWQIGASYAISWQSVNAPAGATVGLALYKGGVYKPEYFRVYSLQPTTNSYNWTVPSTIPAGNDYKIEVEIYNSSGNLVVLDQSNASFSIISETCGGVEWNGYCWYEGAQGETCESVCSDYGGNVGTCQENDNTSCELCRLFHPSASCSGINETYDPTYFAYFNRCDYRASPTNGSCTTSNPGGTRFCACEESIEEPSITVTSPNGGEEWVAGRTYEIQWESSGVEKVDVWAQRKNGDVWGLKLASDVSASLGSYQWTISENRIASERYEVKINDALTPYGEVDVQDKSDNYFSIVLESCHTSDLWDWDYCSTDCKGYAGEGDCDTDADCYTGYCAENVGANYGQVSSMDVCEEIESLTLTLGDYGIYNIEDYPKEGDLYIAGKADLSWGATGEIKCYNIYSMVKNLDGSTRTPYYMTYSTCGGNNPGQISFEANGLTPDAIWYYKVSAVNNNDQEFITSNQIFFEFADWCSDSDYGKDYYQKGITQDQGEAASSHDYCINDSTLKEYFCVFDASTVKTYYRSSVSYNCLDGYVCQSGACIEQEKSITITSPNGGEQWVSGQTYDVTWNSSDLEEVIINLIDYTPGSRYGNQYGVTSNVSASLGKYSWTIPSSVQAGNNYKIVAGYEDTNDFSDSYFSVVEPTEKSITVKFPNGGEKWVVGKAYEIQWESTGLEGEEVGLALKEHDVHAFFSIGTVSASAGKYSWTIPSDISPRDYDMCIKWPSYSAWGSVEVSDCSDNYFSIYANAYDVLPDMVYPVDGQTLDLEGSYMFKVKPMRGASPYLYLFGLFQDNVMVYENWRDDRQLSVGGEFAVHPDNPYHSKFHEGDLRVMIRALIGGEWSDARTLNLKLVPRSSGAIDMNSQTASMPDMISELLEKIKELLGQ